MAGGILGGGCREMWVEERAGGGGRMEVEEKGEEGASDRVRAII